MTMRRFDLLLLCGAILLAVLLLGPVLTIPLRIPINYNEGWNAGFDARAVGLGSGPLYPGPDSFVFDNYPPLGFLIVGTVGRFLFADMIVAGRVIALLSLLASAGLVFVCARAMGAAIRPALAAALLLLLVTATFYRGYVAMDDPQWLAHATMLGGLATLLAATRNAVLPWRRIVLAALLMVAGGFIKHNLVALPVATTLWLLWTRPRPGALFVAASVLAIGLGLALLHWRYGPAAFADIFHHRRIFRVHLLTHAISRLAPLLPAALVFCLTLRRRTEGAYTGLVALFAAIALVTGTLQRMGEGVYYNAHFEAMIAVCLGFGLALQHAGERRRAALLLFALAPVLGAMPWHLPIAWTTVVDREARQEAWRPVIAALAAAPGSVGCEMSSLCHWAGKPFTVDLFNLTQSVLAGGPLEPFRTAVAQRDFALFQDDPTAFLHSDAVRRLGRDPIMASFTGAYGIVGKGPDGTVLLAPVRDRSRTKD